MAYGTKYTIQGTNEQTGDTWNAYIKQRDYTGSNTDLEPGNPPISISYRRAGFYSSDNMWNVATSTCEVSFYDDTTGKLIEVLDADDEGYQIVIENTTQGETEWTGFVIPDSYEYSLYAPSISRIRAVDRLEDLKRVAYANGAVPYTGRDTLIGVITDCLKETNLDLGLATHCMWYPHFSSNNLTTADDVLLSLKVDRDIFVNDDGDPFSCFDVLEQVLISFQLQLYQVENRWFITQRKKNIFSSGGDVFVVFYYDKDGAVDSPTTGGLTARKEVSVNANSSEFALSPSVGGTVPIGTASITYFHGTPTEGLLQNTGFQDDIQTSAGSGTDNWRPGGVMATATLDSPGVGSSLTGDLKSTQALYLESIYESTTGFTGVADAIANLNDYVEQTTSGTLIGGSNITLHIGFNYRINQVEGATPYQGIIYLFVEVHIGSYKLYRSSHTGSYAWSTSPGTDEEKLPFEVTISNAADSEKTFVTPALDDGGTPISGNVYFKIYAPTEDKHNSPNTAKVDTVAFDEITLTVVDTNEGEEVNTATQISLTYEDNVNRSEPGVPTVLFGDGPDAGYSARLTATDSAAGDVTITDNWSYLPSAASSGFSLHQFWANQLLKEYGKSNRKIRASIWTSSTSDAPKPYHSLVFENPHNTVTYDYTWNELTWRPASSKQVLTGSFVQFQETVTADQICTVNVKANTSLLESISIAAGLPCLTTTDFTPTEAATHVYWVDAGGKLRKAQITDTPTWSIQDLDTIATGRAFRHIRVAQSAGYIFTIEEFTATGTYYIMRRNLEGDDETTLLTFSGSIIPVNFAVDRASNYIFIAEDDSTVSVGHSMEIYNYSGTAISTHDSELGGAPAWPAVSPDGVDYWYRHTQTGVDQLRKNGTDLPHNSPLSESDDQDTMLIDKDAATIFIFSSAANKIVSLPIAGGSESDVITGLSTGEGMGYDRINQKLYYPTSTIGDISRCDYDGSNSVQVIEGGAGASAISAICLGV